MAARIQVPYPGEHYSDLLIIEAWIKDRSVPNEAQSLLCSALMKRQSIRAEILQRLADKRGVSVAALSRDILTGKAKHLSPEEYAEILEEEPENDGGGTDFE